MYNHCAIILFRLRVTLAYAFAFIAKSHRHTGTRACPETTKGSNLPSEQRELIPKQTEARVSVWKASEEDHTINSGPTSLQTRGRTKANEQGLLVHRSQIPRALSRVGLRRQIARQLSLDTPDRTPDGWRGTLQYTGNIRVIGADCQ